MDAHTLNAWTRFALQKGGIGSCTALIDNPATDLEDLMFMADEKIIVLRRLDDDSTSDAGKGKIPSSDADSWFLGYCEGVVGRFKGAHVQFHGKLKKPVLMRRSAVGAIRESTLRPMSKSEAANLHASQVPPGIPVTAVDSDDEDTSNTTSGSVQGAGDGIGYGSTSRDISRDPSSGIRNQVYNVSNAKPTISQHPQDGSGLTAKMARLGVTTPPLSDESHARATIARKNSATADSDSDDESDTQLPWARASTASNKSVISNDAPHTRSGAMNGRIGTNQNNGNTLPPSPISSAESPLNSKPNENGLPPSNSFEGFIPRIRKAGTGHTANQSSVSTNTTSESEEDGRRQDHTLSIYEVYGRDSVAFPNFDFRALNNRTNIRGSRLNPSKSNDSLNVSRSTPTSPLMRNEANAGGGNGQRQMPIALRSGSSRRPTAAPPLPATNMASALRKRAEAGSAGSSGDQSTMMSPNGNGTFGTFDPRRRPSMGNLNGVRHPPSRANGSPQELKQPGLSRGSADFVPPMPAAMAEQQRPSSDRVIGSNLLARRAQEGSNSIIEDSQAKTTMRIDTQNLQRPNMLRNNSSATSFIQATEGALPSPSAVNYRPARSSSDRTSYRERTGSGQLKKNPSNPQPGVHGGMNGLMIPSTSTTSAGLSSPSRSPSPLSANGSTVRPFSPAGALSVSPSHIPASSASAPGNSPSRLPSPLSTSPQPFSQQRNRPSMPVGTPNSGNSPIPQPRTFSVSSSPYQNINPANVTFDQLGFVAGSHPPFSLPAEEPEEQKYWRQVLNENDVNAAKKGRKMKKMVQNGIPHSMRASVWAFLASAHVRRRHGLFEELCKVSQSAKGKRGKEALYDAIEKDIGRAYPDHNLFMGPNSTGVADLEAILKAYVHYNPILGYTQGMNLVAGFLLLLMPAEDAFWLLCALLRDVHMEGYYSGDMKQLHVDGIVFGQLLQAMDGELANRLIELTLEPINFSPNWLLPLFVRVLPWNTLLRAWDIFFFEGPTFILRLALANMRILRDLLMDKRVCPGPGEALRLLLHPPQHLLTPENVIPCALTVKLKDGEMRKLSRQASKLVRSTVLNTSTRGRSQSMSGPSTGSRSSSAPPVKRQHAAV